MSTARRFSRRKFLALLGLSAAGTAAYVRWIEPRWLGLGRHTIKLANSTLPGPIKILHLSDFHASQVVSLDFIERAVRRGLTLQPDLILLTGDFITGRYERFADYGKVLQLLPKNCPCFATLGNHDGGPWAKRNDGFADTTAVRELLARGGIMLLHNRPEEIQLGGASLRLIGLGDLWAGDFAPGSAFAAVPPERPLPTLVLSHNPDTKDLLREHHWDVMFCGHTHGGQLRIPLIGTPFAPVRDKRFVKGLHNWEGRWIHITKGIGNLLGLRLNCRPEISLVTLS